MKKIMLKKLAATALCILAAVNTVPTLTAYAGSRRHHVSGTSYQSSRNMKSVAEKVQKAFEQKNLNALADLCNYPLSVVYNDGTISELKNKNDLTALGSETIFSQKMRDAIASANVAKLTDGQNAGVQMGGDYGLNLYKFNGVWKVNSLVLDSGQAGVSGDFNFKNAADAALNIQKTFSYRDLDSLAKMCNYPLVFTFANGNSKELKTPAEFMALGENAVFTEKLSRAIDQANPAQLPKIGNSGRQMGGDSGLNMYQFNGYWKINQIMQ